MTIHSSGANCLKSISLEDLDVLVMTQAQLSLDVLAQQQRLDCTIATITPRLLLLDPFVRLHRIDENNAQEVRAQGRATAVS